MVGAESVATKWAVVTGEAWAASTGESHALPRFVQTLIIARRPGAGERFEGSAGEVLAGSEHEAFEFDNAAGIGGFLFERLEDGLHVLVEVGHGQS